ncbi:hypothetical protein HKX48_004944 [Thoreauomyces humboldtii]|nr:hypothetical protein HKX48_004944 [Thoreauomyces humboldtii]
MPPAPPSPPPLPRPDPYGPDPASLSNHTQYLVELLIASIGTSIMLANVGYALIYLRRRPNRYNGMLLVAAIIYTGSQALLGVQTLVSGTRSREYLMILDRVEDTPVNRLEYDWGLKVVMMRIQQLYSILFASSSCLYLLIIQWRFRVLKSSMPWSTKLDYAFIVFTLLVLTVTMLTWNILTYKGTTKQSTIAAATWSAYTLLTDQILSCIFLYKLSDLQAAISAESGPNLQDMDDIDDIDDDDDDDWTYEMTSGSSSWAPEVLDPKKVAAG